MTIALIAAIGHNRVIGQEVTLPWHISDDLKRFKRLTVGHTVLMGRKTHLSLGKPLPYRRNVVLSSLPFPGVETYPNIDDALHALAGEELLFVIGGGKTYAAFLDRADQMYLTLVDRTVDGDAFFPPYEHLVGPVFKEIAREVHDGYTFVDYRRL